MDGAARDHPHPSDDPLTRPPRPVVATGPVRLPPQDTMYEHEPMTRSEFRPKGDRGSDTDCGEIARWGRASGRGPVARPLLLLIVAMVPDIPNAEQNLSSIKRF